MAQLVCPECHNEISDCPHCGHSLADASAADLMPGPPLRVRLTAPERSLPLGIGLTITGVLGLIGSLFYLTISLYGIAFFAFSVLLLILGPYLIIGTITVNCPRCGKKLHTAPNVQSVTCPHCQAICIRQDNYLEVI